MIASRFFRWGIMVSLLSPEDFVLVFLCGQWKLSKNVRFEILTEDRCRRCFIFLTWHYADNFFITLFYFFQVPFWTSVKWLSLKRIFLGKTLTYFEIHLVTVLLDIVVELFFVAFWIKVVEGQETIKSKRNLLLR